MALDLCGKRLGMNGCKEADPKLLAFSRKPFQQAESR